MTPAHTSFVFKKDFQLTRTQFFLFTVRVNTKVDVSSEEVFDINICYIYAALFH